MSPRVIRGACPHDCPDTCSMLVTVEGTRARRVRGNPKHRTTAGFLCAKVNRYLDRTYHPDRILHPMVRSGAKGEAQFRQVSWNEALDRVKEGLQRVSRPEAILPYSYSGTLGLIQNGSMDHRFFHRLGASQLDRTICSTCGSETLDEVLGTRRGPPMDTLDRARTILLWGTNTLTSNVHLWPVLQRARTQGAHMVAIDPRRTETAARADAWLAPRPGSDAALAYGMMRAVLEAELEDQDYLRAYTVGYEGLRARIMERWPLSRAAELTGLEASTIRELALRFAETQPSVVRLNYGLQRHAGGGAAVRAILHFVTLVGAWRHAGGGALLSTSRFYPTDVQALARPDLMPEPTPRTVNMNELGEALAPEGDVECLFVYASNPATVAPDQEAVLKGLAREDLFTVVHELFMTDTACYADVLLPATSQLEQLDIHKSYGHVDVLLNDPSIEPLGEAVSNTELFRRLADRMGFDEPCFQDDDETLVRQAFRWDAPEMAGIDVDVLRREGPQRLKVPDAPFAAPERPIDLRVPSGEDGYTPPAEIGLDPKHPLALISPPAHHFLNSSFANLDFAHGREREPELQMHPQDAQDRGLQEGHLVEIKNERGAFQAILQITEDVRPGVVIAPSIWWNGHTKTGRNANAVTSQRLTDIGRGATFYDCAVEVVAADESTRELRRRIG
ncbi:MAG: molybdopterin oxidoreductase family protein [Myxococcota bacterium]